MTDGQQATSTVTYPVRLARGHGFPYARIRSLIQDALTPMPMDPVPTAITLTDIQVTLTEDGNLEITCEVAYAY